MKKQLWLIIFLYAVLLAGCSLLYNHFILNDKVYNKEVELNEIQNKNEIQMTLNKVIYYNNMDEQRISVTFKLENLGSSPAVLTATKNQESSDSMLLLKNPKKHFLLVGHGLDDIVTKKEDDTAIIFSFPAGKLSSFEADFLVDNKLLEGLECHIPLFINNEKVEFIFPIPSPNEIDD
ncbi:hypothetical protein [Lederbergia panacisoli]|uniref:hypothetical protein n=1 Tax=Lederbergia panacisoli TaxID=1255251 RepID=UPI00214BB2A0|nr:hypothetical protein [Lederbergia panacisoli]MCR2820347.1 hypothetical protein [Lederbergia panacisoli]